MNDPPKMVHRSTEAIIHFKDSEEGRAEVCKTLEEYAVNIGIDMVIEGFIYNKISLKKTIAYFNEKYPQVTKEYITKKYNELA